MAATKFAVIGGGWRAEFFVRAAAGAKAVLSCEGVTSRRRERREELEQVAGVAAFASVDEALDRDLDFVVLAVTREAAVPLLEELTEKGSLPVLLETPPGLEVAELRRAWEISLRGARAQVAEQYRWQPHHAARLAVLNKGVIGERYQALVSVAHGYHAASLFREYLGVDDGNWLELSVTACKLSSPVVPGPGRYGPSESPGPVVSDRTVAVLTDGQKHAIYDFDGEQYFSEIRGQHVSVRGERGELVDDRFTYFPPGEHLRARQEDLIRYEGGRGGDLTRFRLDEVRFEGRAVYQAPGYLGAVSDEEAAIAQCLYHMGVYAETGEEFYPVERACRDRYIELAISASLEKKATITFDVDGWKSGDVPW